MNINVLWYSLFGIAGGQEVDHTFVKSIIYPLTMIASFTEFNGNMLVRQICRRALYFQPL